MTRNILKHEKAQIQSQAFIYVFALIVLSLILFFGIKTIGKFKKDTTTVSLVTFEKDFQASISAAASEYDSVQKIDFILPSDYKICFSDPQTTESNVADSKISNTGILQIKDEISSGTKNNVFIIKDNLERAFKTTTPIKVVSSSTPPKNFLCVSSNIGKLTITMIGKGRYTQIS